MKFLFLKSLAYVTLAASALLASACKESDLYVPPVANNTVDEFYKDEYQVNQGVVAIYNGCLSLPQNSYWYMGEFRSDNIQADAAAVQRDYVEISNFNATSQTGQLQATWTDLYEIVYRANVLQERSAAFTFARINQFRGEARFLRALAYFDLVRYWGAVPIVPKTLSVVESKTVPRAPIADVYKFIVDDLKFAADNLPTSYSATDKGRATKWAAKALLGKVYLTMYGYPLRDATALQLAKQQLADVYAASGANTFSVAPNFSDLFKVANENKYAVFELQYISGGTGLGNPMPWEMGQVFPSFWSAYAPFGNNDFQLSPGMFGANWPKIDKRKAATLDSAIRNPTTGAIIASRPQFTKYLEKGISGLQNRTDYPNNLPVIRFEDVVLMYSEVLAEEAGAATPTALGLINQIRTRSGLAAYTTASPEAASLTAFRAAMLKERRYEFVVEGAMRWHDLVRTGNAIDVMTAFKRATTVAGNSFRQLDSHDLLFPIPLLELRINPGFWQQNPGYN